jgi:hypothetical protein
MKLVLYSILLGLVLLALVSAESDCPYNKGEATLEYTKCELIKPYEVVAGDSIIINCTHREKVNNRWEISPLSGKIIYITGYNDDDEPLEYLSVHTKKDGTYEFAPGVVGTYLIQVEDLNAWFDVGENPIVEMGVVDKRKESEEPVEENLAAATLDILEEIEEVEEKSLMDAVVGDASSDEVNESEISGFALMLVSLLLA